MYRDTVPLSISDRNRKLQAIPPRAVGVKGVRLVFPSDKPDGVCCNVSR